MLQPTAIKLVEQLGYQRFAKRQPHQLDRGWQSRIIGLAPGHHKCRVGVGKEAGIDRHAGMLVKNDAQRRTPGPQPRRERRIVGNSRAGTHQNGVGLGTQTMHPHRRDIVRDTGRRFARLTHPIDITIMALCPFKRHKRPATGLKGHKGAVQLAALFVEYPGDYLDTRLAQTGNAPPRHCREGIETPHHDPRYLLGDYQLGTRRSLSVMRAGLERDIQRRPGKQRLVGYRGNGIHLGMSPRHAAGRNSDGNPRR